MELVERAIYCNVLFVHDTLIQPCDELCRVLDPSWLKALRILILEALMMKITGTILLLMGMAGFAFAGQIATPEIDAATGVAALTLLTGALLVIRGRKKR